MPVWVQWITRNRGLTLVVDDLRALTSLGPLVNGVSVSSKDAASLCQAQGSLAAKGGRNGRPKLAFLNVVDL